MATRIYTRTGDSGETSLFGGQRVAKDHLRLEAFGTLDELNAFLGSARTHRLDTDLDELLQSIQNTLFDLGAELATPAPDAMQRGRVQISQIGTERTGLLEQSIDQLEAELAPLTRFILPGGTPAASALHVARTVCRRAERRCIALSQAEESEGRAPVNGAILAYLNRLSDLLFVMARVANRRAGVDDVAWTGSSR
jgi:cob(I)alamin adenosyltransferase